MHLGPAPTQPYSNQSIPPSSEQHHQHYNVDRINSMDNLMLQQHQLTSLVKSNSVDRNRPQAVPDFLPITFKPND